MLFVLGVVDRPDVDARLTLERPENRLGEDLIDRRVDHYLCRMRPLPARARAERAADHEGDEGDTGCAA